MFIHALPNLSFLLLGIFLAGCATHPTVSPVRMKKGDSRYGYTLSTENLFPYLWYRLALTDVSDIGLRVGLPLYGTGLDFSRMVYSRGNKWDLLNVAWSLNPNYNIDFTYYKFKVKTIHNNKPFKTGWWGLRGMYIPKGIMGKTSVRLGLLKGGHRRGRFGYEVGYYHDYGSMPFTAILNPTWKWDSTENKDRYGDTPHADPASGMPSEFSRLTGLSIMLYFDLGEIESDKY